MAHMDIYGDKWKKWFDVHEESKLFLEIKFGVGNHIPKGTYAIPTKTGTTNEEVWMKVRVLDDGNFTNFNLFWDEALTISWHSFHKDGTGRAY